MNSRQIALLVLFLLVLVSACRRQESGGAGSPRVEGPTVIQPGSEGETIEVPDTPPSPDQSAPSQPSAEIRREALLPTAYSVGDSAPSAAPLPLYDYELGELTRSIPTEFVLLVDSLGSELPLAIIAPEWQDHMIRQTSDFEPGPRQIRLGRRIEDEGLLLASVKIIADNQLILGSIRGRRQTNGEYLIEDLAVNTRLYPPYRVMVLPPPLLTGERNDR